MKRQEAISSPPTMNIDFDAMSDMTEAGIRVVNISKGAESVRERGNDMIFSITLNIETYAFWQEDFRKDTLKKIVPGTESFY